MLEKNKFMCGHCKKTLGNEQAARDHARDAHRTKHRIAIFCRAFIVENFEDEPSISDRTIDAELATNCGEETDDRWLLGK